jgi:TRAP-type mannitol/chloroaromatic compound transport system permease small subunit
VHERQHPGSALFRLLDGITMAANAMGTLCVLALVSVINFDVVSRSLFNEPFHGAVEVVQFSMVLIVFLQLPDVVRVNRMTRSDGFLTMIERHRRVAMVFHRCVDLISAAMMAAIAWAIWPEFVEMWHSNDYFGVPGVFTAPWWPVKFVIFVSTALCSLLFALKATVRPAGRAPR